MMHITTALQNILIDHAQQGYPHEVVGILAGSRANNHITKVYPLINERADTHNRYQVSALTLMRAEQSLEAEGFEIIGYYHSHPDHSAQFSDYDRDHALPNMSYLILSIQNGTFQNMSSWRLREDRSTMDPETITLTHL